MWSHLIQSFIHNPTNIPWCTYQRCIIHFCFACGSWLRHAAFQLLVCIPACICFCYLGIHYIFTFLRHKNLLNISEAGSCPTWSNIALQWFLYTSQGLISDSLCAFSRQQQKENICTEHMRWIYVCKTWMSACVCMRRLQMREKKKKNLLSGWCIINVQFVYSNYKTMYVERMGNDYLSPGLESAGSNILHVFKNWLRTLVFEQRVT